MRNLLLLSTLFFLSTACARTGVHTMCVPMFGGQVACHTRDFDAENRQAAARDQAIRLNACVEGRQKTNPSEAFSEAEQRCQLSVAAQNAAAQSN